jgi:hypothetical protein
VARRKRKSGFSKLRAKANKAIARRVKATRKRVNRATRKLERKLASNSLARAGRRASKRAVRKLKRTVKATKRTAKAARKQTKSLIRRAKKYNKDRIKRRNAARRAKEREFNRLTLSGEADLTGVTLLELRESSGASKPGEPPKMRTGKGRKSITAELRMKGKKPEARTYVDKRVAPYMAMWEFRQDGEQRPFLKPAVQNNLNLFGAEIGNALKQQLRPQAGKKKAVVR